MLLSVEPDGPVPIYQQIRDRIVEAIAGGRQPAGSGLPSTRQLAVDLGVNFHTVNKSYDLLRQEGLLRLNRKSGAVVQRDAGTGPPPRPSPGKTPSATAARPSPRSPSPKASRDCGPAVRRGHGGVLRRHALPYPGGDPTDRIVRSE